MRPWNVPRSRERSSTRRRWGGSVGRPRVIETVRKAYRRCEDSAPALAERLGALSPLDALIGQLEDLLDDDDELRDDASTELRRLRAAIRDARQRARQQLERMVHTPAVAEALQDGVVTERHGRLVLPVRAGQKDRIPGVVHDSSSSGQTLFIEPLVSVEAQNKVGDLEGREREEIARLLAEATAHVRAADAGLREGLRAVALIDALQAVARWAEDLGAVTPTMDDDRVELRELRHPLLAPAEAVPPRPGTGAGRPRGRHHGSEHRRQDRGTEGPWPGRGARPERFARAGPVGPASRRAPGSTPTSVMSRVWRPVCRHSRDTYAISRSSWQTAHPSR